MLPAGSIFDPMEKSSLTSSISTTAVVPVPDHPVPALPPKEPLITLAKARDMLERYDLDGSREEHGANRTWTTFNNGIGAALSAGHCFPVLSAFCAPASIVFGGVKVVMGLFSLMGDGDMGGICRGLVISGAKSMALGASVFLLPGVSEALSAAAAIKDGADAVNASVDK